jgi:hypothetical protein
MAESELMEPTAIALVRTLSGAPGYPFHPEGESRVAHVLMECSISVEHARAVVEEFESDFPTMEQIRNTAYRLRSNFDAAAKAEEAEKREREKQDRAALKGLRDSVPLITGVRWEICLQIQCLRIAVQEAYQDQEYYLKCQHEYPEAMAAIRAGRDPDPAIVERRYRELHPNVLPATGLGVLGAFTRAVESVRDDLASAERSKDQPGI